MISTDSKSDITLQHLFRRMKNKDVLPKFSKDIIPYAYQSKEEKKQMIKEENKEIESIMSMI